jgi:soluble lytic murein transglycosylase-like protein
MTWHHSSKTVIAAIGILLGVSTSSSVWAEGSVISPQDAEKLVQAQIEEQKAAEAVIREETAAIEAEVAAEAAKTSKLAKKRTGKKSKEAAAAEADTATAHNPVAAKQAIPEQEKAEVEVASALPVVAPKLSNSARMDVAKGSALKPLISQYAAENGLPYELADAVIRIESRYNPSARNGPNMGLTQINVRTAQSLGYKGETAGLLDAETNLRYGLKYLAVAYKLAGGDTCGTILRYQFGHRTTSMTGASRTYCAKVKVLTAAAD